MKRALFLVLCGVVCGLGRPAGGASEALRLVFSSNTWGEIDPCG